MTEPTDDQFLKAIFDACILYNLKLEDTIKNSSRPHLLERLKRGEYLIRLNEVKA